MYGCEINHKENWVQKNWCFWTVVLKKTLESPLDCKEIKPVNPKGNQFWLLIGRTDAEGEVPILCDVNSWLIGKTLVLGMIEGGMRGVWQRMRWSDGIIEWMDKSLSKLWGFGGGQGNMACCSHGVTKSWTRLSNRIEQNFKKWKQIIELTLTQTLF